MPARIHLIRHGETEWSLAGRHTGRADPDLTARGEERARGLAARLQGRRFSRILASPRLRARRTCELAGLGAGAEIEPELAEWDYGDYEGLRTAEIHQARPDWDLFRDGGPNGESPEQVSARADRVIARLRSMAGNVAVFTHGHFGRVLAARWVGWPVTAARRLQFDPVALGILGFERDDLASPAIALWNDGPGAAT